MVQRSVDDAPIVRLVTPEDGEDGEVTIAEPEITVHIPVPTDGVFAANVAVVVLQRVWLGPAIDADGNDCTVIVISSVFGEHPAGKIVQRNVADVPSVNPVTEVDGEVGEVIVAVPETTDQVPVPEIGVFPDKLVEVRLHNI